MVLMEDKLVLVNEKGEGRRNDERQGRLSIAFPAPGGIHADHIIKRRNRKTFQRGGPIGAGYPEVE